MAFVRHFLPPSRWLSVLAGAPLFACSASPSTSVVDASSHHDASERSEASGDGGGEATTDDAGEEAGDDADGDGALPPTFEAGGPPACQGPLDCTQGQICCLNVAAERVSAACVVATKCPSNEAELCGVQGTEKCKSGMCQDYECTYTAPPHVGTFFACGVPPLPTVSCGVTNPPSPDAGTNH